MREVGHRVRLWMEPLRERLRLVSILRGARLQQLAVVPRTRTWGQGSRGLAARILRVQILLAFLFYLCALAAIWFGGSHLINQNLNVHARQVLARLSAIGMPSSFLADSSVERIRQVIGRSSGTQYVHYYDARGQAVGARVHAPDYVDHAAQPLTRAQLRALRALPAGAPLVVHGDGPAGTYRVLAPLRATSGDVNRSGVGLPRMPITGFVDLGLNRTQALRSLDRVLLYGSSALALAFFLSILFGRYLFRRVLDSTLEAAQEREEALRKKAEFDPLTGLVNRERFMSEAQLALEELRHDRVSSALLFIDLDQFKYVNDTVGHGAGDRLLVQVSEGLSRRIREHDVVARFGGDEFIILARDVDQSGAIGIARGILFLLQGMNFVEGEHSFNIRASIGISMISSDQYDVEELISQADMACYEAKNRGRNRYNMFESSDLEHQNLVADVGWSQRIRNAIDFDRFRLNYQPMVGTEDDDCEMYEVLLRLPDEHGVLVSPLTFLPAAERFGLMVEIDYWVIDHALRALQELRASGRDICLSINLSGHVFEDQALASRIVDALEKNDIPGSRVIFEVTEQSAVRYMDSAASLIRSLRNHGCRFALDDFGSGFSSYNYIKNLPIDFIKISGEFIEEMRTDRVDQVMVRSIVEVARALGKKTIAESVADRDTLEMLQKIGVDFFQGRFCGGPVATLPKKRVLAAAGRG
jgi:diguanylate cyclase (GGDEF)-like protein